ncbi:MAG TPA: hemerythrin domain-containing protein [Pseudorhodoferax sp.]|nr:hemerythrin domain-containing protein [Pseudorhodoferax sp.]
MAMQAHAGPGQLLLGEPAIDAAHRECEQALARLLACPDTEMGAALQAFEAHAHAHFGMEDELIARGYPAGQCHLDEHRAVLASVAEVRERVAAGHVALGRRLARELARWFPEHTDVMDRGLAAWLLQQRTGGARLQFVARASSPTPPR